MSPHVCEEETVHTRLRELDKARGEQALLEVRGALEPASCPLPGCQNSGVKGHVGEPRGAPHQVEGREESWELWAPI